MANEHFPSENSNPSIFNQSRALNEEARTTEEKGRESERKRERNNTKRTRCAAAFSLSSTLPLVISQKR
jgi:hypothetical protein